VLISATVLLKCALSYILEHQVFSHDVLVMTHTRGRGTDVLTTAHSIYEKRLFVVQAAGTRVRGNLMRWR